MQSGDYKIVVDSLAVKDMKHLATSDRSLARKVVIAIDGLVFGPFSGKPLKGNKKGCYSLRCGDWRIIYEVYSADKIIQIIRVGHRKDIYR